MINIQNVFGNMPVIDTLEDSQVAISAVSKGTLREALIDWGAH
jgi:hypothetical protein